MSEQQLEAEVALRSVDMAEEGIDTTIRAPLIVLIEFALLVASRNSCSCANLKTQLERKATEKDLKQGLVNRNTSYMSFLQADSISVSTTCKDAYLPTMYRPKKLRRVSHPTAGRRN